MIEFSRPQRLDAIGAAETTVAIEADTAERAGLAARFGLIDVKKLAARCTIRRDAAAVLVRGTLEADVVQACSVTEEPVPAHVEEAFALRFLPEAEGEPGDEVELDEGALDTVFYEGGAVDHGEAVAETLALALDPYPRSPNAAAALREAGVLTEEEAKPQGALAGLKDMLKKAGE